MKAIVIISFLIAIWWVAYRVGYNNGLIASPEYAEMKDAERIARDARWAANDLRAAQYQAPDVEECLPVMEVFERDIVGYCVEVMQNDERSRYNGDYDREPAYWGP